MAKEYQIKIEIDKIRVIHGYYYFKWKAVVQSGTKKQEFLGQYDSSHSRQGDIRQFKKELKNGYAVGIVLDQLEILI